MELAMENVEKQATFKNAIITLIELNNGENTQMITLFNFKELDFEELQYGIVTGLSECKNVHMCKNIMCSIKNGILKPHSFGIDINMDEKRKGK